MPSTDFTVRFSTRVARVLECEDEAGVIEFGLDSGDHGDKSLCLEHHPASWPRGPRYDLAFHCAKEFLESCGYQVEVYGS